MVMMNRLYCPGSDSTSIFPNGDDEPAVLSRLGLDFYLPAVLLLDDGLGDRQAQSGALAHRLGGEEGGEQMSADVLGDAGAVVLDD